MLRTRGMMRTPPAIQARPDVVDRIMDGVAPGEWGPAAEMQLCYEIKARHEQSCTVHAVRLTPGAPQTFVLAGHETSAAMLTWSLFELSRNPVRRHAHRRAVVCGLAHMHAPITGHRGQGCGRGE